MTTTPTSDRDGFLSRRVQERGHAYARQGRVRILEAGDGWVHAAVRGTRRYEVTAVYDGDIRVSCSCPYPADHGRPCKHAWAALLVGYEEGYLPHPEERHRLLVEPAIGHRAQPVFDDWRRVVSALAARTAAARPLSGTGSGAAQRIVYLINSDDTLTSRHLRIDVVCQRRKRNGEWGVSKRLSTTYAELEAMPDAQDREILAALGGSHGNEGSYHYYQARRTRLPTSYEVAPVLARSILPKLCETQRCFFPADRGYVRHIPTPKSRLRWEDDPWELRLEITPRDVKADRAGAYTLMASFVRGAERLSLDEARIIVPGLLCAEDHIAPLATFGAFAWIELLASEGQLIVPTGEGKDLLAHMLPTLGSPPLEVPPELRFEELALEPRSRLHVAGSGSSGRGEQWLRAELAFGYDDTVVAGHDPHQRIVQADRRRVLVRDPAAEARAVARLGELSLRPARSRSPYWTGGLEYDLRANALPALVQTLISERWHVEAAGNRVRSAGAFRFNVASGIDWFDLHGGVEFDDQSLSIPQLLAAHRRGETMVQLDDGTVGILPELWLTRYAAVAGMGELEKDRIRFRPSQVAVLDALLAAQSDVGVDDCFTRARDRLLSFEGVEPADAPAGFTGRLRGYQREGLGWMRFLAEFGLGGCLADDMGLGKTVQVLALLASRRGARAAGGPPPSPRPQDAKPSLIVVPRSLVFNWKAEAARFTPGLDVLDHTGATRAKATDAIRSHDVVLTTYGTLRRDAQLLMEIDFDYVVLDESQLIKNAASASAKAVRLLRGDHRLALSGTPIENHLDELWSLCEFLNPGMLGTSRAFRMVSGGKNGPDAASAELIARAVRPLILRRTKAQVARELPDKVEQSLVCELGPKQRELYDELRDHYRQALTKRIANQGLGRSKILVLEALLRLRQAACHARLVNESKRNVPSAKLDMLIEQLESVRGEGHKALVFSQFTSLLAIVRERLDRDAIDYAYLDGRTRDRQRRVERFQNDPGCKLFLISLKAGGVGLNLTAAEYVYLLDPWWNPAVELQAIDRTHRIGQTRRVFAYRLIAKDTVEQKIVELQARKRELADSIIKADATLIRSLSREDLELLLS